MLIWLSKKQKRCLFMLSFILNNYNTISMKILDSLDIKKKKKIFGFFNHFS